MEEEGTAEQNLASFSQATHYISEWKDLTLKRKHQKHKHKEVIHEEHHQSPEEHHTPRKTSPLKKENSEKYDLKKWEQRMKFINKIEYPLLKGPTLQEQDEYVTPKYKNSTQNLSSPTLPIPKIKNDLNRKIFLIIEDELIQKKLEKFKQQMTQHQKQLQQNQGAFKYTPLPKSFTIKKHKKQLSQQLKPEKHLFSNKEINLLYKSVEKQHRKLSLPSLTPMQTRRYSNSSQLK